MQLKKKKKLLSFLVVLSLVFSLGINTFALDDFQTDNAAPLLDNNAVSNEVITPEAVEVATPGGLEEEPPGEPDVVTPGGLEEEPSGEPEAVTPATPEVLTPEAMEVSPAALLLATENNPLEIKSVEVLNGGNVQILYRPEVYKGVAENGEDPEKYYTTQRDIDLKDPRIFNVEFTVPAEGISDPGAFLDTVDFTYGGSPLSEWGNGKDLRGSTSIFSVSNKQVVKDAGVYKVSADIKVDAPTSTSQRVYMPATAANASNNIPYSGYIGGTQSDFDPNAAQSGDNRGFFQFGPTEKGPGTYALEAVANEQTLAAASLHIGPYDGYHSWIEINEFCQSLIEALNGHRVNLNAKPTGVIASGTVVKNPDGTFAEGDGVYVEVSVLGYGLTNNYDPDNIDFNNYSQYNAIWNVVVAKDARTVDNYLKPGGVKDQMNNDPQALIDQYKDADPEDIDLVLPYYQNNVHPDEVAGTDGMIHLIDQMIEGGKGGKDIPYKTFDDSVITYNYRPSGNTNTGYTAFNDVVNPDAFYSDTSRTQTSINTSEVLDKFIMVNTLCSNPDGKAAMRRVNRYGLDLNRDTVYATQPETIALTEDIAKWDPLMMLEWHGYVTQMLIEPCTAPHSQNYEPDLTLNNMIQLAYSGGRALTANTGYNRFHLPWDSFANGWDDGGNVYGPMFAMLFGCMGWTIEEPYSNEDSLDATDAINYGMLNELMHGHTAFYPGNVLNGSIDGKDSHEVDNKYASMRQSTVMNKLEFKLRGVQNIDSNAADKYFIDVVKGVGKYVGRARKDDGNGGKLAYFPDYLVIPGTPDTQFNVAEAYRTIDFTMRYGAEVSKTTEPVTYNGVTYPAGTYLYDMKQGRRNFINEIMSKGYDATNFASMYADIYCNFPDTRGFDCVEVWSPGLFSGKTEPVASVEKKADIAGTPDAYVVFKSNSTDAVRFVNLLLSGRSSGPSFINSKESVWMLRKSVDGVGTMSDYIIEAKNLDKIYSLVDNPDLGLKGCHLEGKYIGDLPKEAVQLVEPVISMNSTRNAATAGGSIYWALDDFLGFGSMKYEDGTDYNGNSFSTVRKDANVVLLYNAAASGNLLNAIKSDKLGLVMVQSAASLTDANFGTGTAGAPTTGSFNDVALYGTYNVDDSLITANYANTDTIYARGNYFTGNIPAGSKVLFKSKDGGAFIGGYQNTGGSKAVFQNQTTMFSTILKGGGITDKPVQSVTFGSNIFYRPHYQKYYPMLATAIFAGAAGILDDQTDPVIDNIGYDNGYFAIIASDDGSGMDSYALYRWDTASEKYVLNVEQDNGTFALASDDNRYMIVAADYAGNEAVNKFGFKDGAFYLYATQAAPDPFTLTFALNSDGETYTATIPLVANGLYSFDGKNYSSVNTKTDCLPGTSYTGYVKYAETETQHESAAVSNTQTAPKLTEQQVAKPAISPDGGSFSETQTVTISCDTEGAEIYYTTDGTDPTSASTKYSGPFSISATTTVKVIAAKEGMDSSEIASAIYTKTQSAPEQVKTPAISPDGGSFKGSQTVTISCDTEGAEIYYTTDGTAPTSTSIKYSGPFSISSTTAVKAIALKAGMNDSAIASVAFTRSSSHSGSSSGTTGTTPDNQNVPVTTKEIDPATGAVMTNTVSPDGAREVKIELPTSGRSTVVHVPAPNAGPGTVAVLVKADGTEEIIRTSVSWNGELLVPLSTSCTIKIINGDSSFSDTNRHWASDSVAFVTARGLFSGITASSFSPDTFMTRGMLVTVLHRLENKPSGGAQTFNDVQQGMYYADAVAWAAQRGIVTGVNGGFQPDANITREQLAAILYRYAAPGQTSGNLSTFSDSENVSPWAVEAMQWAVNIGLFTGDNNGKLNPGGNATRAEVAAILQRFITSNVI